MHFSYVFGTTCNFWCRFDRLVFISSIFSLIVLSLTVLHFSILFCSALSQLPWLDLTWIFAHLLVCCHLFSLQRSTVLVNFVLLRFWQGLCLDCLWTPGFQFYLTFSFTLLFLGYGPSFIQAHVSVFINFFIIFDDWAPIKNIQTSKYWKVGRFTFL